jgi:hypothetical protein
LVKKKCPSVDHGIEPSGCIRTDNFLTCGIRISIRKKLQFVIGCLKCIPMCLTHDITSQLPLASFGSLCGKLCYFIALFTFMIFTTPTGNWKFTNSDKIK